MSLKICGHKVRWQKPIKIYTLLPKLSLVMALFMLAAPDARAAEFSSSSSTVQALPCALSNAPMPAVPSDRAPLERPQRTAGPSSPPMSPAMALALALGVRDIAGPVVRTERRVARTIQAPSRPLERQALILPGTDGRASTRSSMSSLPLLALER